MLDEFDVPNVEEAVESIHDEATTASWERIKTELMESQTTAVQQLKAEILPLIEQAIGEINGGTFADAISPLELAAAKLSAV